MANGVIMPSAAPNDYALDYAAAERQRKLADALQAQSAEALPTNQTAGGWVIPISPAQGLAKLAQALSGAYINSNADKREQALTQRYQADVADTMQRATQAGAGSPAMPASPGGAPTDYQGAEMAGPPSPATAGTPAVAPNPQLQAQILSQNPATAGIGMNLYQQNLTRQALLNAFHPKQPAADASAPIAQPGTPLNPAPDTSGAPPQGAQSPSAPTMPQAPSAQPAPAQGPSMGGPAGGIPMEAYLAGDPTTGYANYLKALQAQQPKFGEIAPKDYTPASIAAFAQSRNPADLVALHKQIPVNLGGTTGFVDPYAPPTAPMTHTVSPDTQLTNNTRIQQDALNRGVTMRGQNMTDARQREANGILEGQNTDISATAKAIASHDLPMPNPPSGSRNPMAMIRYNALVTAVKAINPTYNAQDYQVGTKAMKDFATGKQGQAVKSFNVALAHLDTLGQIGGALQNGDIPLLNKLGNVYKTQTGQAGPGNFNAAKQIVGDEIVKAIVGAGGTGAERETAAATVNAASSPQQLQGVINTYKQLMQGQLSGLRQQYQSTTGRQDFDRFLTGEGAANEAPNNASANSGWSIRPVSQ